MNESDGWHDDVHALDQLSPIAKDVDQQNNGSSPNFQSPSVRSFPGHSFMTSTPRPPFAVHRRPPVSRGWLRYTLLHLSDQESATLLDLRAENSQGYEHFYTDYRFHNSGWLSGAWLRLISLLHRIPKQIRDVSSSSIRSLSRCEIPRGRERSDLINLSELFPPSATVHPKRERLSAQPYKASPKAVDHTMGSLYRSEPMKLCEMILVRDATYDCVAELGKYGIVQFNDLNANKNIFQRTFVREVRRCEELERKLRFLERQVVECVPGIKLLPIDATAIETPSHFEINNLETQVGELELDFVSLNKNDSYIRKNLNEMREFQYVLQRVEQFFEVHMEDEAMINIEAPGAEQDSLNKSISAGGHISGQNDVPLTPLLNDEKGENAWFVAGVIPLDKRNTFERVLWRACRRTAFVRISDVTLTLEDPVTLAPIMKCVFIVFFKGESLKLIIDKVCDGFNARQYPCPKTSKERQQALFETIARIQDLKTVIDSTKNHRFTILENVAKDLPIWLKKVHLQKAIYNTLNLFTVDTNGFLAAECWIPEKEMDTVHEALCDGLKASGCDVAPILNEIVPQGPPPTYHRTNKFTSVFQSIVDSYGVASYREVNPAPYTIITFPFLFAVMFGDAAHGLILFLAGLFFILNEKKITERRIRDEIFNTFFGGRYIIVLMGLFSIYTGILYNDAFAKSFNVFGSSWASPYNQSEINSWLQPNLDAQDRRLSTVTLDPATAYLKERGPYPFGVDPVWNIAVNRLSFLNSMKMKMSVIIGVLQMTFGLFLSLLNHIFFKSKVDILTNFIPQMVFMSCIFLYLCVQMVAKWVFFSVEKGIVLGMEYPGSHCAPSLLIGLINMFMLKERPVGHMTEQNSTVHHPTCFLNQWYPDQEFVEKCLLITALCCIPVMLAGRPLAAYFEQKKMAGRRKFLNGILGDDSEHLLAIDRFLHEHSVKDEFLHQAIHTIEFVLGCVSHTASYLRLWALSLAHAQLSEVLWEMVLIRGLSAGGNLITSSILSYVVFFFFAVLSLSILVIMEGLSAFLHALRLHWVEFQSKFYQGAGHAFRPYSLQECLETAQHLSEVTEDVKNAV
uniref:V-type proton ATPase subunit a n=1 Tax=Haemonchus contortus TaxID=6289 RepID=A0A7I4YRL0_HAECO|nr:ATPase domain containing protein [Haemonchus contortus]